MFIDFSTINGTTVGRPFERELKVILSPDTNRSINNFTFILSTLAPNGGCTDFHVHDTSGELMIFMSGSGKAWFEGIEYDIKPGTALYAPPGSEHKTMNTGNEPLMIACIFIPAIASEYIVKSAQEANNAKEASNG